jgi:hypothetical protein
VSTVPQLISEDEAAGRLGMTPKELAEKRKAGGMGLSHYRLSPRVIRYDQEEVDLFRRRDDIATPDDLPTPLCQYRGIEKLNPQLCGIYFLVQGDEVVYVGQSVNLHSRISSHIADGHKQFDRVFFRRAAPAELNPLEARFIRVLRPKLNKAGKPREVAPA